MTITNKTISEDVASRIKDLIFKKNIYKPGDKLPVEKELMHLLQVSRTALREGIKYLESEDILVVKQGSGTFVSIDFGLNLGFGKSIEDKEVQLELLNDWYDARLMYEVEAIKVAASSATDEEIKKIEMLSNQINENIQLGKEYMELDMEFHRSIIEATHNKVLLRLVDKGSIKDWLFSYVISKQKEYEKVMERNALDTHRTIVNFLKIRDGLGAALALRYHLLKAKDDWSKRIE